MAVAQELNFSRAAAQLHLAQQSLSAQIQQLEHELQTQLLLRTTRRVEVTEGGRVFLEHAQSILSQLSMAVDHTRRAASGMGVQLGISATPTLGGIMRTLLGAFEAECPDISIQVHEMWQAESVEAVRSGRLHIGLARGPVLGDDLDSTHLLEEPVGVVLGEGHPLAASPSVKVADLADSTLVLWPRDFSPNYYDHVVDFYRSHGFRGPIQTLQLLTADSFHRDPSAQSVMAEGRAFTVAFATEVGLSKPGYVWRPTTPTMRMSAQLYWRRHAAPAVRRIIDVAEAVSESNGWRA